MSAIYIEITVVHKACDGVSLLHECRVTLGRPVDLFDVRRVDELLGELLERLVAAHRAWAAADNPSASMLVDGTPIDDLSVKFLLPGALLTC